MGVRGNYPALLAAHEDEHRRHAVHVEEAQRLAQEELACA
jgi:hypothetical protein